MTPPRAPTGCATPSPHLATDSLAAKVVFTNTYSLTHVIHPANELGFANYTTVLKTSVQVSGSQTFDLVNHRNGLPVCNASQLAESKNMGYWVEDTWYPLAVPLAAAGTGRAAPVPGRQEGTMIGDSETRIVYWDPSRRTFTSPPGWSSEAQ